LQSRKRCAEGGPVEEPDAWRVKGRGRHPKSVVVLNIRKRGTRGVPILIMSFSLRGRDFSFE